MKILFLCGSLEPGRDGVGDYTRRLAIECQHLGQQVAIIAINEKMLAASRINDMQQEGSLSVLTHRLSAKESWGKRKAKTEEIISRFSPEIISFQYVSFSFHNKGIPYFLPRWMSEIAGFQAKWHFMFHELWITESIGESLKDWLLSQIQKQIIKKLLNQVNSPLIHTSTLKYHTMLKKLGFRADVLPIFSNLPKGRKSVLPHISDRKEKFIAVFFGHLHEVENFAEKIKTLSNVLENELNKQLEIIHIGANQHPKTLNWINQLPHPTFSLGFLTAQEAADIIYNADIGLSNYPVELVQKSGSIASILYNGLPVIVLSSVKTKTHLPEFKEVKVWDEGLDLQQFIDQKPDFSSKYDPRHTAQHLLEVFKSPQ